MYWFIFQKVKYTYDNDEQGFIQVRFPTNEKIQYYTEWKGHQTEEEINIATSIFDKNQ